ncbi:response regulator transcription factor [Flavobacteriales bacterium]|nr:response regulator transcription factor [Flavobacteriales bacterium]
MKIYLKIVIASPRYVIAQGVSSIFKEISDEIIFISSNQDSLERLLIKVNPALVIIDDFDLVFKPEKTIAFLSFLKPAKTVILSDKIQRDKVELLERVGVCQFFSSFITQPQIHDLLDAVSFGKRFYDERIKTVLNYNAAEEFKNTCSQLNISEREVEIIKLIAEGFINKEIADKLFLSTHTVNTHRKNIMSKLGVNNATGIVIFAVRERLISPNDFLFSSKH